MKNWSQRIEWNPSMVIYPTSEAEVQEWVHKALQKKQNIRIIGSGHSFNPLWVTEDLLISLDKYQGLVSVDKETLQVTVKAGTKLNTLGDLLFEQGMAMENLGDIDVQSLAGTIGTGTHGTGLAFGTISTQVKALQFVNGKGEIVFCSETENHSLFKAAQVSLGALGIITQITLQCVPAYKLELWNRKEELQNVLDTFDKRITENRNFEFYYFPHSKNVLTKSSNVVTGEADKVGIANYLTEYVLENYIFKILCEMGRFFPSQNERISKISASSLPDVRKVFHSHKVYATQRLVRFNEMEYNIPLEAYGEVFKEVIRTVEKGNFAVHFPIESRVVKGDDVYLSPAYGRNSAYIACHVYNKKDYKAYFKALEDVFLAHGGRPHWGKMHTLEKSEIAARYPMFEAFSKHRKEQDPNGLFLNEYLKGLFL